MPKGSYWKAKTHCPQGHPYDEANTSINKSGSRCCRSCLRERARRRYRTDPTRHIAAVTSWQKDNPDRVRQNERRRTVKRYGLSIAQYQQMLSAQNDVCAICKEPCKTGMNLAVDHDHATGAVRGLLCASCNNGIGRFRHNEELLEAAIAYLKMSRVLPTAQDNVTLLAI